MVWQVWFVEFIGFLKKKISLNDFGFGFGFYRFFEIGNEFLGFRRVVIREQFYSRCYLVIFFSKNLVC